MKKPTRAAVERSRKVAATVTKLEPHRDNPQAVWDNLPDAWGEVFGVPLDMADPHDLMVSQVIFNLLVKNLS